ncbi:hypothetical protein Ato02nite_078730 [Paractinoplanes toevensis]|uniref:Peptidase S8/S53 domain-containing protein n=1 Tax=Paractinoplanes toevensis TaxID=571911 RepID=A0A919W9J5_9ACTN|nr:hypothetical protein Ato02nite_078730 [Actinoplanes toevensis]
MAALAAAITVLFAAPAQAAPPANQLYYTVTVSYQSAPENLWEIATRFLGDASRAGEILDLNAGRVQPDGDRLADPGDLTAGWQLLLPWDATGAELHNGPLPAGAGSSSGCARSSDTPAEASWAQTLLTPSRAWPVTNGAGVKVGIVASGVDGSAAELAGRVAPGADVVAGAGRGDVGCEVAGTNLAGIVAGDDDTFGVAPGARIVPVRAGNQARSAATGISVAVAAGAKVVLLGVGADASDADVRAAVSDAISRDVVVVTPAWAKGEAADGLLRVGAIGADKQPAFPYAAESVDLLAPGTGVTSIGGVVSGDEYAAAYVAGTVALVRAAHPGLRAADATRQVLSTTTDRLVNPVAAVNTALPAGVGVNAAAAPPSSGLGTLSRVLLWIAVALAVLLLLPFLLRRPARMVTGVARRRWALRQAQRARARLTADHDDPFWEAPVSGPGRS